MSDDREIVCNRFVFVDSEFDAKKGQGEPPGPPVCICAVEIDQHGRVTEHRLAAPYPARPPWERRRSIPDGRVRALGGGGKLHARGVAVPAAGNRSLCRVHGAAQHRDGAQGEEDSKPPGPSLIKACQRYGVTGMDQAHKEDMRSLAYTKTDHTPEEIAILQDYCIEDAGWSVRLFKAMRPHIDFLRAPIRGAFMMEIERMRWHGIPIDMPTYRRTEQCAADVAASLRTELNRKLGAEVYYQDVFKRRTMLAVMRPTAFRSRSIRRPGKYSCATKLIKSMIETYPLLKEFYEDKRMIDAVKNLKLEIGADGRNRFWLNPFGTKTGRNNPSTNRCVLGLPHTMRSFIKPPPGMALAQVDYRRGGGRHRRRRCRAIRC